MPTHPPSSCPADAVIVSVTEIVTVIVAAEADVAVTDVAVIVIVVIVGVTAIGRQPWLRRLPSAVSS